MRRLWTSGVMAVVGLAALGTYSPAQVVADRKIAVRISPLPERVAMAETIVTGKVTAIEDKKVEAATATAGDGSLLPGSAEFRAEAIKAVPIAIPATPANEANQILRRMEVSLLGRRRCMDGSVVCLRILANTAARFAEEQTHSPECGMV